MKSRQPKSWHKILRNFFEYLIGPHHSNFLMEIPVTCREVRRDFLAELCTTKPKWGERAPLRKSHIFYQFLSYFDKTSLVVKVRDRSTILNEWVFKIEPRSLDMQSQGWCFGFMVFMYLVGFFTNARACKGVETMIKSPPSVLGNFLWNKLVWDCEWKVHNSI